MNIIILGGTGLIGYHTAIALLEQGNHVTIVSRGNVQITDSKFKDVNFIVADVFKLQHDDLLRLLVGFDAMVYAIGPDDREVPKYPAKQHFNNFLVDKCLGICEAAKQVGHKELIVLSSYFCYFNRIKPEWELTMHHPYIQSRVKQSDRCMNLSSNSYKVVVLEIPYVFGTMPMREPLWKEQLVARLNILKPFMVFTTGGTAMASIQYMAQAVCGALTYGKTGSYIVGEQNMSWKEMLIIASSTLPGFIKKVITIPTFIAQAYGLYEKYKNRVKGKQAGLDYPKYIRQVQSQYTYFPEELMRKTAEELKLSRGSVRNAMKETFLICK